MNERGWVLAVAIACGGGGVGCGNSGGETPDSSGPDTTAPKIIATSPMGNAPILATLTATFDESLDPATVTAATVRLATRLDDSFPAVPGTVTYDAATNTVSFTPMRPLTYDAIYELQIGAVTDASSNAFAGTALSFHAVVNAVTRETSYTNNVISYYVGYELDANGHQTKYIAHPSYGTNMTWFDSDDPVSAHEESDYSPEGLYLAYRQFGAGSDTLWNTSDDPVVLRDEYTFDAERRLTKFAEFLADQTVRIDYSWADRKLMTSQTFDNPGDDAVWNTADDRGPQWRDITQDATGATTRVTTHSNGGDQKPVTSDDFISLSTTFDRDPTTFAVTKQVSYGGPGTDQTWLTNDDAVANYITMATDSRGLLLTRVAYSMKGNDNTWFTSDDVISSRQVATYDAKLCETNRNNFNGAGNDGMWGTPDDALLSYTTTEYDAAGNRTKQRLYTGAGMDGNWHTSDDELAVERTFDTTH